MSIFGSTKTNFSVSEMSLASSTLVTAASTYTISDGDYETSSELQSPRIEINDSSQISRRESSVQCSINSNYVIASQSSSVLMDKTAESVVPLETKGYMMSIKSDTCIPQQSKVINDFMNDMLRVKEQQSGEPNPMIPDRNSSTSLKAAFLPTTNAQSDTPVDSYIETERSFRNADDSVDKSDEDLGRRGPRQVYDSTLNAKLFAYDRSGDVPATLSQTKHKIMENLAQVTHDKLFSKPGLRCSDSIGDHRPTINRTTSTDYSQSVPLSKSNSSRRSQLSRQSLRRNGVESILRIDYELQPLNIMLSRLLAEFRAMDLRGKIEFIDPNYYDFTRFADWNRKFVLPEVKCFNSSSRYSIRNSLSLDDECVRMDLGSRSDEILQDEKEPYVRYLQSEALANVDCMSYESLNENMVLSRERSNAQTSRSCENNCPVSRDLLNEGSQISTQRVKSAGKRDSHMRCCYNRHQQHIRRTGQGRRRPSYREVDSCCSHRCLADGSLPQKDKIAMSNGNGGDDCDNDDDFGRKSSSTDCQCGSSSGPCEQERALGMNVEEPLLRKACTRTKNASTVELVQRAETIGDEVRALSCPGLILPTESCSDVKQPPAFCVVGYDDSSIFKTDDDHYDADVEARPGTPTPSPSIVQEEEDSKETGDCLKNERVDAGDEGGTSGEKFEGTYETTSVKGCFEDFV